MMDSRVTVIIPVYNTKEYLEECVCSIMAQTYRNIEILLIDDGSTDGSSMFCDELAEKDSRVRVIHKPNEGVSSARNLGISEAEGNYIMFVDSDDWLDTDAIETLIKHADMHKTDVIRFNYVREFAGKQRVKRNTFLKERVYSGTECLNVRRQILGLTGEELSHPENMNFLASCCTNMYKREFLVDTGVRFINMKEIGAFEDGFFNFCVFLHVKTFEYIDKPFYHYRKFNKTSETTNYRRDFINRQLKCLKKLKSKVVEIDQPLFNEAFINRVAYSTMEIAFNAMVNKASFRVKYEEIKCVLNHLFFKEAYRNFNLKYFTVQWKVYFFFIKQSMALPTFLMTAVILKIKNRGTV